MKAMLFPCLYPLHSADRMGLDPYKTRVVQRHNCDANMEHALFLCETTSKAQKSYITDRRRVLTSRTRERHAGKNVMNTK